MLPAMMDAAARAVSRARADLVSREPFFGCLVLTLRPKPDPSCRHIWTDGATLGYHPAFAASIPHERLVGALAHEALHLACGHHARRRGRDPRLWNEACDVVVNDILQEAGFRLPEGALFRPEYAGRSVDAVYRDLLSRQGDAGASSPLGDAGDQGDAAGKERQTEAASGQASSRASEKEGEETEIRPQTASPAARPASSRRDIPRFDGEIRDAPRLREGRGNDERARQDVEADLERALDRARHAGAIPAGCSRLIRRSAPVRQDWGALLRRFLSRRAANDYSWLHPDRRRLHQGLYLPGRHDLKISSLAVAVDCSGSVDDLALSSFCAELGAALAPYETEAVILFHDCRIQSVRRVSGREFPSSLAPVGGGGTDFRPVTAWLEHEGERPAALIWFTDLECSSFPPEPSFPVLWLAWGDGGHTPPFGEVVRMSASAPSALKEFP